jgi:hypothetical protein
LVDSPELTAFSRKNIVERAWSRKVSSAPVVADEDSIAVSDNAEATRLSLH